MATWSESVKAKRQALKVTQGKFARRLGISRRHLNRIENGHIEVSASLQEAIDLLLKDWQDVCELNLIVDYIRVRFPTHDTDSVISNILQLDPERMRYEDHAFYGYSSMLVFANLQVMVSMPNDTKLGTLLEIKGQGCRELEGMLVARNEVWFDFFRRCLKAKGIFKRIDLAINDMVGMLDIPALIQKCERDECISVMRKFQGIHSGPMNDPENDVSGATLYIGSMKSDIYFCLYEKAAEQIAKRGFNNYADTSIKNRFELRLKNERAFKAVEDLLSYRDMERTVFGIITRYMRFVDSKPNKPREQWPINKRWANFCCLDRQPLRLTLKPEPFDLTRTRAWIDKQVAPTLNVLMQIDGYNGNKKTMNTILHANLKEQHTKIIEQYTEEVNRVEGDYFENEVDDQSD